MVEIDPELGPLVWTRNLAVHGVQELDVAGRRLDWVMILKWLWINTYTYHF